MKILLSLMLLMAAQMAPTLSHAQDDPQREAAAELLRLISPKEVFVAMFSSVFDARIAELAAGGVDQEKISQIKAASVDYAESIASDPDFERRMIDVYVEAFSESELQDMLAFYGTATGKKSLKLMPELVQRGAIVGQDLAKKHEPAFMQAVNAIMGEE